MYCIKYLARAQPNQTVLMHGAAGGLGIAVIQISKLMQLNLILTANSSDKQQYLSLLGVENILDSKDPDIHQKIQDITNNQGVDIILNTLVGNAAVAISSLKCLGVVL